MTGVQPCALPIFGPLHLRSSVVQLLNEPLIYVAPEVALLRGFGAPTERYDAAIAALTEVSPFRQLYTPGGRPMSAFQSSCGACGWYSDARGYRYESLDPLSGAPWPPMPDFFVALAR